MSRDGTGRWRRWAPEAILAAVAAVVFLGCLGSVDLWGKREQRASAEALDTVARDHWLIAEIQGRPRLEKPPLPRWTIATLMIVTGRRDAWLVRLPSALSALGMVGLAYALGRRVAGRSEGLAAGLVLASSLFFIGELRQAGNDGPLALFTTMALYAAWRRLHGEPGGAPLGSRGWAVAMYGALGLGFLSKGPIVAIIPAVAIVPYLAAAGRLREGLRALLDWRGLLLFALLALSWPVPVLLDDPNAARVWYLEMAQKAGTAGVTHHRRREFFAVEWPWMTAPWTIIAVAAVTLPWLRRGRPYRPAIWFPWSWAVGNLAMFCLWKVAKPNYFLPCLPGAAVLTGIEWVRLTRAARQLGPGMAGARRMLQLHWVLFFAAALAAPAVVRQLAPGVLAWTAIFSAAVAAGVLASAWAWRKGADALAMAPMVSALAVGVLVGYGAIAPSRNAARGHRELAGSLDRVLPPGVRTVMFYRELDEGLWFYLRGRALKPVPNSQPRYNKGLDLLEDFEQNRFIWDEKERVRKEGRVLIDWLRRGDRETDYVLIRATAYDLLASPQFFGDELTRLARPVLREHDLERHELVLLHAPAPDRVASRPSDRR